MLAAGVAACDGPAGPERDPSPVPVLGPDAVPASGRLITIAARPDGRNVVEALDLASGEREALWETGPEVADWRVAPDGGRAAYRAAVRSPQAAELIEVRELVPASSPRVVVRVDPEIERLGGHAFGEDGELMALRQGVGAGGEAVLWRLPGAPGGAEPSIWHRLEDPEGGRRPALQLLAWSSTAQRAVVREDAPDGGPIAGARFVASGQERRLEPPEAGALLAAAPDAAAIAWLGRAGHAVIAFEDRAEQAVAAVSGAEGWATAPLLAAGGRALAWQEAPAIGGSATVRLATAAGSHRTLRVDGEALVPLAFAPDGSRLVLGAGPPEVLDPARLLVADVGSGELIALPWPPPDGLWGAAWVVGP